MLEILRFFFENYIAPRDKISLNGLGMTKDKARGLSMMMKTGLNVAQDHTVLNYGPSNPLKKLKSQDRTIVSGTGFNLVKKCSSREK